VKRGRSIFALGLAIGLLVGVLAAGSLSIGVWAQDATPSDATNSAANGELSAVEVVQRVSSAVVTVINEQTVQGVSQLQPVGSGTGFIIDTDGHIVTNWHVVTGGQQFQVIFANGEQRDATLVGSDEVSDLAVVKVDGDVPGIVPLGDSDALMPGQTVLAIGSPLGSFTNTVTEGIVSATNRDFPEAQSGGGNYTNLIQHDAAINPGNSGGPLFNLAGEVVGVNTLGIPEENGQPVQGLFFAIPSNTVKKISQILMSQGAVTYPFFGIQLVPVNAQIAAQEDLSVDHGVLVEDVVAGGPAEAAGIKVGDVIVAIDGQTIDAQNTFTEVLFAHKPGDTVEATVQRGDQQVTVKVTLGTKPTNPSG
jgi:serine protease Do